MKTSLILNNNEIVLVSDEEIKDDDNFLQQGEILTKGSGKQRVAYGGERKKVLASELSTEKGLIIPKEIIEEIKGVDIKGLADIYSKIPLNHSIYSYYAFIHGYNQALQDNKDKRYTLADLEMIYEDRHMTPFNELVYKIEQSQTKKEWKCEIEMEEPTGYEGLDNEPYEEQPKITIIDSKEYITIKSLL